VGVAYLRPGTAPAMPLAMRQLSGGALARRVLRALVPPVV
jgi:TRAP-type mannitol/chloroaromatic compound transport system permease large subunit